MFEPFSFLQVLIIILIGLLFFKENLLDWIGKKLGIKNGQMPVKSVVDYYNQQLGSQIQQLVEYYNHDTTEKLDKLLQNHQEMRDVMKDISNTLDNIDRFGVKCRDK